MAADEPLSRLALTASSVVEDLGYVALADLSSALASDGGERHRVIGGHMVTALVARWRLGADLYRETADTDIGVPPVVVRDHLLIDHLRHLGYEQVEGNRFARTMADMPVHAPHRPTAARRAVIDILVPAYTSRARQNVRVGDGLVTTEVPGLATALQRPPAVMRLDLHRLNGEVVTAALCFPDEVAALMLKALATKVRNKATDVVDVWRCLEVAFAAGVQPEDFTGDTAAEATTRIRELFDRRDGAGLKALVEEQRLSVEAADQRFTRLRALVTRVIGRA